MSAEASETETRSGWTGWIAFASVMMLLGGALNARLRARRAVQRQLGRVGQHRRGVPRHHGMGLGHAGLGRDRDPVRNRDPLGEHRRPHDRGDRRGRQRRCELLFIPVYPIWALTVMVIGVLVIWALTAHGSEMKRT